MLYPDDRLYVCKFCGRKFDFSYGFNSSRLIEHLFMIHNRPVMSRYGNLYLSDMIKECYENKGVANDGCEIRVPAGY